MSRNPPRASTAGENGYPTKTSSSSIRPLKCRSKIVYRRILAPLVSIHEFSLCDPYLARQRPIRVLGPYLQSLSTRCFPPRCYFSVPLRLQYPPSMVGARSIQVKEDFAWLPSNVDPITQHYLEVYQNQVTAQGQRTCRLEDCHQRFAYLSSN
jgi:hypothetical protein